MTGLPFESLAALPEHDLLVTYLEVVEHLHRRR